MKVRDLLCYSVLWVWSAHWWTWGRRIDETVRHTPRAQLFVEAKLQIFFQNVHNNSYLKTFHCIIVDLFNGCVDVFFQNLQTHTRERLLWNEKIVAFLVLSYFLQSFGSWAIFWLVTWCLRRSLPRAQAPKGSFSLAQASLRRFYLPVRYYLDSRHVCFCTKQKAESKMNSSVIFAKSCSWGEQFIDWGPATMSVS